jgi:polyhydroxyalkanoate synthesis regulator phasin
MTQCVTTRGDERQRRRWLTYRRFAMPREAKIDEMKEVDEMEEEERNRFFQVARKVVLAGFGAVGLAQDELEEFINRLVERGEIAEKDARKLMHEVTDKRRKTAEKAMDKRLDEVLERMNVPSKTDIEALSHKITALTHKVDELKKA